MTAKSEVRDVDRGWKRMKALAIRLNKGQTYVKVGVLSGGSDRTGEGPDNVDIATIHEFGSPKAGIPERSWIRSTVESGKAEYLTLLDTLFRSLVVGNVDLSRALNTVGAKVASDIQKRVRAGVGIPPPNAPSTIARKGSSRPLIDTGQMVNSTSWQVVIDGKPEGAP